MYSLLRSNDFEIQDYEKPKPMSAAERKKRQRQKNYEIEKKKSKEWSRIYREKMKYSLSETAKKARNENAAERMRQYRQRKKLLQSNSESGSYFSSPQVKGKVIKKVRRVLTGSPRQNTEVLRTLLLEQKMSSTVPRRSLPQRVNVLVTQFYDDDEISRASPNQRDCITVKDGDKTIILPARYLLYSLREVHGMFLQQHTSEEEHVSFSAFAKLKPKHVKPFGCLSQNVCCCILHENLRCRLTAIKKNVADFAGIHVDSGMHLNFVCNDPLPECFQGMCSQCQNHPKFQEKVGQIDNPSQEIKWNKWVKTSKESTTYCNVEKVSKCGTVTELLLEITDTIEDFLNHEYVKLYQAKAYHNAVKKSTESDATSCVLVFDFAEKFKITNQNEVQSAHYGQTPITIFTVAEYFKGLKSKVIVSDFEKQTKDCIIAFIVRIMEDLPPEIQMVDIFTDNAGSQFKNQYLMESLKTIQKMLGKTIRWNFFAPMHGKSVVDGIGGSVKRFVRRKILAHDLILKNAQDFQMVAVDMENVEAIFTSVAEIEEMNEKLNLTQIIKTARPIKNIKSYHYFYVTPNGRSNVERVIGERISHQL